MINDRPLDYPDGWLTVSVVVSSAMLISSSSKVDTGPLRSLDAAAFLLRVERRAIFLFNF
jgi:hypothetical protein